MEHLSLELVAGPLRLIATKNEKSRGELNTFLTKPVSLGEGRRARADERGVPGKGLCFSGTASIPSSPARRSRCGGEHALPKEKQLVFLRGCVCAPRHVHFLSHSLPFSAPRLLASMFFF